MHEFDTTVKKTDKFIMTTEYEKPIRLPFNKGYRGKRGQAENPAASLISSLKRTKKAIYDYAIANDFNCWVTGTTDKTKINRHNFNNFSNKVRKWLSNQKRNYPNLQWLIVPEMDRGGGWHFHSLMSGLPISALVDSGIRDKKGRIVYNWPAYAKAFGHNTIIDISNSNHNDHTQIANYITKYITKEMILLTPNKQRYWASEGLKKPDKENTLNEFLEVNLFDVPIIHENVWHIQDKKTGEIKNTVRERIYLRLPY